MRLFFLISLVFLKNTSAIYSQSEFGITIFGTDQISRYELVSDFNKDLNYLFELYKKDSDKYEDNRDSLSTSFYKLGDYSLVNIEFFTSYTGKSDLIIDFVEAEDAEKRLIFRETSRLDFPELKDLFEAWKEYEGLSFELFRKDEISDMSCPVIHCIWSFNHAKLEPYLSLFNEGAREETTQLIKILNSSSSERQRATSSFLLSHADLGDQELLNILLPSVMDSSSLVRNNSMRVIYYILRERPELDVELDKIIKVLNYPSFTDRNKALVVLRSLPLLNLEKKYLEDMIPILIEILEKKDAHNFRNAHLVLQKLSGLDYPSNQISEWKAWANPYLNQ